MVLAGCVVAAPDARQVVGDAMVAMGDAMADGGASAQDAAWRDVECRVYAHTEDWQRPGVWYRATTEWWYALVDVGDVETLLSVDTLLCDLEQYGPPPQACPEDGGCSGEYPPVADCGFGSGAQIRGSTAVVYCGQRVTSSTNGEPYTVTGSKYRSVRVRVRH